MSERRKESAAHATPARKGRRTTTGKGRGKPKVRRETARDAHREPLDAFGGGPPTQRTPASNGGIVRTVAAPRPLHIVMVGWEWPPNHSGGLGVHSYEISKELTRLGHRITFLTPFGGPFTPVDGVTFRFPGGPPANDEKPPAAIDYPPAYWSGGTPESPFMDATDGYNVWVSLLEGLGPVDVVHVHDWFGTVGARALSKRLEVPLVMSVHSTEYDRSLGHPWQHILDREQIGIDAATRVIAVSRHLRQQIIDRYHADPAKMKVVYNAVRPSPRLERIDPAKRVVLYVGRLAVMKGVDTYLRAAARIAAKFPDVLFVVAGEGPEYNHLVRLAAGLGIGDHVMFLGRVTEEERDLLLAGSSVFVLPSVVEPFGIAALEAMAAGVPTILSKTSGVAEVTSGAFTVDFWDADEFASRIAELLEYPTLRAAMGEQGRWEALREGWPERARETVGVYLEAMSARGRHP